MNLDFGTSDRRTQAAVHGANVVVLCSKIPQACCLTQSKEYR
jgi:predicted transcriptional regulator